jgi:hypothetical protein
MDSEIYHVYYGPSGQRCVREYEGERYVLVRLLPVTFLPRLAWVKERDLCPHPSPAGGRRSFPVMSLPPIRSARPAHG